jgi:hypothetical protein
MPTFRLYNLSTSQLEIHNIDSSPPYIALSHTWSDQIFSTGIEASFGGSAIRTIVAERHPALKHCWIDNFCILQNDEADKFEQIPLMGAIYDQAEVVAIVLTCEFGFNQSQVDRTTLALQEAVEAWREEEWAAEAFMQHWRFGPGRELIVQAMTALAKLTKSSWGTRIWTLQEYILARSVIWIGSDMLPVVIDDMLFQALPGLCDQLPIEECMSSEAEFKILYTHFSGMASSRLEAIDRTRTMELLGNRKATVPVDEVYGIMACCGVEIVPVPRETREEAWIRWWGKAVSHGHVRWIMLPPVIIRGELQAQKTRATNCVRPEFAYRHTASGASMLNSVAPLDTVTVSENIVTLSGRAVGYCTLLRRLGSVHESASGMLHRDITLILFARGRWSDALQIVEAFGPGRYNKKQHISLAQVLVDNYRKALSHTRRRKEMDFIPYFRSEFHHSVWGDMMQLQARCIMAGLGNGIGYLARIVHPALGIVFTTAVIVGDELPIGPLVALDFEAATSDQRSILLIAELPLLSGNADTKVLPPSLHKLGTTIPVTNDFREPWDSLALEGFSLGGSKCHVCTADRGGRRSTESKYDAFVSKSWATLLASRNYVLLRKEQAWTERLNGVRLQLKLRGMNRSRRRFL